MNQFKETLSMFPTAVFWLSSLEMSDILSRFLHYECEGNWQGHLHNWGQMLPFMVAEGHFKYGQQSLLLYLKEMKNLLNEIEHVFKIGGLVVRRSSGRHNPLSPDMLLEQTYNADANEGSGLDGQILMQASRTKSIYTNPTAAVIS